MPLSSDGSPRTPGRTAEPRAIMGCPRSDELCPASASWCDFLGKESREAAELPCCAVLCSGRGVTAGGGRCPRRAVHDGLHSKAALSGTAHTHDCCSLGYVVKIPMSFVFPRHSRLPRHQRRQFPEAVKPSTCLHNSTCTL